MLRLLGQKLKNETKTVILIFAIRDDTNLFMASLSAKLIKKTLAATTIILSFFQKEAQFLTSYLFFYLLVINLARFFMKLLEH